jgi:hypothetical protein
MIYTDYNSIYSLLYNQIFVNTTNTWANIIRPPKRLPALVGADSISARTGCSHTIRPDGRIRNSFLRPFCMRKIALNRGNI